MNENLIELTSPGDILREEFLEPLGITPYRLAKSISVPQSYLTKVFKGGGISSELSLLLDKFFELTPGFWSRLQSDYDARMAKRKVSDKLLNVTPINVDYIRWKPQCDRILQDILECGGTKQFDPNCDLITHKHLGRLRMCGMVEYINDEEAETYRITEKGRQAIFEQIPEAA